MTEECTSPSTSKRAASGDAELECLGKTVHLVLSVPTVALGVKLQKGKRCQARALLTMLFEAMMSKRLELLSGRTILGLRALALILPR